MKKLIIAGVVAAVSIACIGSAYALFGTDLKTQMDKVSYSIGYDVGNNFKSQNIAINPSAFSDGLEAGVNGKQPAMTTADMQTTMQAFQQQMMEQMAQKQASTASTNLTASQAYMQKMASQPGVKELETGLYYQVITAGKGRTPSAHDTVTVNYEGSLINGTVFDSSYKRNQPISFQVDQVIPGWQKALVKMPVGSTWMLYISPELAYGQNAPPSIGPNQALTFKVELISASPTKNKKA
ncbi:MAG: FKBP-type peptidyl-prolyl cis-trans isomerase [Gammaproteobacteria bacterium]|nr:FKBP-type peptidyl-prolyl cis-trans isomerase [Gammaproteobacteria bacterium]